MIKLSKKRKIKKSKDINITKAELEVILKEESYKIQKLMLLHE